MEPALHRTYRQSRSVLVAHDPLTCDSTPRTKPVRQARRAGRPSGEVVFVFKFADSSRCSGALKDFVPRGHLILTSAECVSAKGHCFFFRFKKPWRTPTALSALFPPSLFNSPAATLFSALEAMFFMSGLKTGFDAVP